MGYRLLAYSRNTQVVREVDRRHATFTEFGLDAVAAFKGCVQAGDAHASKMQIRSAEREEIPLPDRVDDHHAFQR